MSNPRRTFIFETSEGVRVEAFPVSTGEITASPAAFTVAVRGPRRIVCRYCIDSVRAESGGYMNCSITAPCGVRKCAKHFGIDSDWACASLADRSEGRRG